jgi:hypothetical protein
VTSGLPTDGLGARSPYSRWEKSKRCLGFLNRAEFDLEMRGFHELRRTGRRSHRGSATVLTGLVGGEWVLEQAFGRCRPADAAQHVDQGAQRGRHLPVA